MTGKHLLIGMGSRGDVQPLLSLASAMQSAGIDVTIAAGENFRTWVEGRGVPFAPMQVNIEDMMNSPAGLRWVNESRNPIQEGRNMRAMFDAYGDQISEDLHRIGASADVLISNLPSFGVVQAIAEKYHKQHWLILLSPLLPTTLADTTFQPMTPRINSPLNRLSGYIGLYFTHWVSKNITDMSRQSLGLPAWRYSDYVKKWNSIPLLCGYSPLIAPPDPRWHDKVAVTGYWIDPPPADYTPPAPLAAFLADGEPPVYIGFGSMSSKDPQATTTLIIEALQKSGRRGIIYSGWAGLNADDLPRNIFLLDGAPHEWLFPRTSAVIHHGGAGTTAAALRAGVPSAVISHMADQPYWGRRIAELGVGVPYIRRHKLTADKLTRMITKLASSETLRQNARILGEKLCAEDGVGNAIHAMQRWQGG